MWGAGPFIIRRTTSNACDFPSYPNHSINQPSIKNQVVTSLSQREMDDIAGAIAKPIGIKQLLMVTEMARQGEESVSTDRFLECLHICGF